MEMKPMRLVKDSAADDIIVNTTPFSIGRSEWTNVCIKNVAVSRSQCILKYEKNEWLVLDQSSSGTFINGKLIGQNNIGSLKIHDVLSFGMSNYDLTWRFLDNSAHPQTDIMDSENDPEKTVEESWESNFLLNINAQLSNKINELETILKPLPNLQNMLEVTQSNLQLANTLITEKENALAATVNDKKALIHKVEDILETELSCGICHELLVKATTLRCCHTFCEMCLNAWKKSQMVCPMCRKRIVKNEIHCLVIDNLLNAMTNILGDETKAYREKLIKDRAGIDKC